MALILHIICALKLVVVVKQTNPHHHDFLLRPEA